MTREEAKEVFINRGFVLTNDGNNTIYDPDKWRESVNAISKWLEHKALEQEPCESVTDYLETCYVGARAMDDVEECVRIARAIEAYNTEPCEDGPDTNVGAIISRQAVLDKIRAEIIELRSRQNVGVLECLDIIDKYRESEDKSRK